MSEPSETKVGSPGSKVGLWLAIGAGMGASLGVATGETGVWLPVGVAVGLAIGVGMSRKATKKDGA